MKMVRAREVLAKILMAGGGEGEGANSKREGGGKEMEVVKMEKVKLVRMKQDVGVAEV
jgi:hypothetical protein